MEQEVNLVFDIETNGLLDNVSTIHCAAIYDLDTKETITYNDTGSQEPIVRGIQRLADADCHDDYLFKNQIRRAGLGNY